MSTTAERKIWVLGGTSAIAQAYGRLAAAGGAKLLLTGRNGDHLKANADDLTARGGRAAIEVLDLAAKVDHDAVVGGLIDRHGFPDEVLIAYGILGDQERALSDLAHAADIINVNYVSVALWLLSIRARRDPARPLTLVVIGSVAGDRGRARNFIYGSAKGGLDVFLEGLAHAHAGTSLHVVRVKPGFVDTPMTAAIEKGGPLWAKPDRVAQDIQRAVDRHSAVVYAPWFWRPIMLIIRLMPRFLFNRLKI
ncbi:MAG TPA: SDR family NAD(P)-dependent oxidoreductase [Pseudolabrys sp.]|jgi:short-subunit dehydrogenase